MCRGSGCGCGRYYSRGIGIGCSRPTPLFDGSRGGGSEDDPEWVLGGKHDIENRADGWRIKIQMLRWEEEWMMKKREEVGRSTSGKKFEGDVPLLFKCFCDPHV